MTTFTFLGGGHGLYQTLLACRRARAEHINAVVTVADDGGSSGRLRRELGMIPPGDLRMALSALMPDTDTGRLWRNTLQHRFQGNGAMAGHAVGNLLLAGLSEKAGGMQAALDVLTTWAGANGRVIPVCNEPLEIEADVAGLDDDPRVLRSVRGLWRWRRLPARCAACASCRRIRPSTAPRSRRSPTPTWLRSGPARGFHP